MRNFRFFIKSEDIQGDKVFITGEMLHKIKNVLRYKKGDEITLLLQGSRQAEKKKFIGRIECISERRVIVNIIECKEIAAGGIFITLYLSLIKAKNFETAIQKATELGVDKIVPLRADRSVVKISGADELKKKRRWEAIARESASQCKRADIPVIADIASAVDLRRMNDDSDIKFVCDENCDLYLKDYFCGGAAPSGISAAVGPEGGFTPKEISLLNSEGFKSVLLGRNILRSETVPLYLMSIIHYKFGG